MTITAHLSAARSHLEAAALQLTEQTLQARRSNGSGHARCLASNTRSLDEMINLIDLTLRGRRWHDIDFDELQKHAVSPAAPIELNSDADVLAACQFGGEV